VQKIIFKEKNESAIMQHATVIVNVGNCNLYK